MKHIYFVSENISKYNEIENYLKNINNINNSNISIQMIKPELKIQEIQSLDRSQIIIRKLQDAYSTIKSLINYQSNHQNILYSNESTWIMVDDTSLNIAKMGGFPGSFIKYYLQSLSINSISHANWGSNVTSYVTLGIGRYVFNSTQVEKNTGDNLVSVRVCEGFVDGVITEPRGENGFGYDPIFRPNGSLITNAEMSVDEKEKFNPRTLAFQKVINLLMN